MQEAKGSAPMIHRLPCTIHHRGPGAISNFFQPQKLGEAKGAEGDEYKANFRGLELKGRTVSIPEGSKGLVLETQGDCLSAVEAMKKPLKVVGRFNKFLTWDFALSVAGQEQFHAGMNDWSAIAKLIHDPLPLPDKENDPNQNTK
ncbi:hypothetical protein AAMO2058_001564900 [Amorphochlora amoebiformis]